MPLEAANGEKATTAKAKAHAPIMETRGSKFVKFQEARLQEMADEVGERGVCGGGGGEGLVEGAMC